MARHLASGSGSQLRGVIKDAESFIPVFKSENDGTGGEGLHMKKDCQETVSGNIP